MITVYIDNQSYDLSNYESSYVFPSNLPRVSRVCGLQWIQGDSTMVNTLVYVTPSYLHPRTKPGNGSVHTDGASTAAHLEPLPGGPSSNTEEASAPPAAALPFCPPTRQVIGKISHIPPYDTTSPICGRAA